MFKTLKKKILSIVVVLSLVFTLIPGISASAETAQSAQGYVALGDSVSYGMSAFTSPALPNYGIYGYVNMFNDTLKYDAPYPYSPTNSIGQVLDNNLSKLGATSTDLLKQLNEVQTKNALKNTDIITINIGGNNLLKPFIDDAFSLYNITRTGDTAADSKLLYLAILKMGSKDAANTYAQLSEKSNPLSIKFKKDMQSGVSLFISDWSKIMKQINILAPNAVVYVNTIYNPLNETDPLYSIIDGYIGKINKIISAQSNGHKYKVVDVYASFKTEGKTQGALSFDVLKAIDLVNSGYNNYDLFIKCLDPHPTLQGHVLIYNTLMNEYK